MPRVALTPPPADEMIDVVITLVVSSRMILKFSIVPVALKWPTPFHHTTNRRFGALPIVWYMTAPGGVIRSSQRPATRAVGALTLGRHWLVNAFEDEVKLRNPFVQMLHDA